MPTVPVLQQRASPLADVRDQVAPNARATFTGGTHNPAKVIDTFGIEQGQKLAGAGMAIGQDLARVQIDMQNQVNQTRLNEASNQAIEARLKLTYDKDAGYINLQGKAALDRPDGKPLDVEYGDKFKESIDAISAGLGNDAQRRQFAEVSNQMLTQFRGGVMQHSAREYTSYELSVQDGTVKTAQQQMGLAWGDVGAIEQSKGAIKAAVYETGKLKGWSGQQTQAAMVEQLSAGHSSVLSAAIDAGKLDYAKEYMTQNNAELTPEVRLHMTKVLEVGQFEAKTQGAAETLYAEAKGDISSALAAARSKYSGKEEDAIVQRIKGFDQEKVVLRERAQATAADSAWQIYSQTGSISRIPPSTIAAMDGKALHALRNAARADADAAAAKTEVKTDPNIYYGLSAMEGQNPTAFKALDLRTYFDKLSPGDRKRFIDSQTDMGKPEKAAVISTVSEQRNNMVKQLGLKGEDAGVFVRQADEALRAAQAEKGSNLNETERQKVLDKLVLKGEVLSGHWYLNDPNMRYYEARAKGQTGQFAADFNDNDRNKAKAALQRKGIKNPTNDQITTTLKAAYGLQ